MVERKLSAVGGQIGVLRCVGYVAQPDQFIHLQVPGIGILTEGGLQGRHASRSGSSGPLAHDPSAIATHWDGTGRLTLCGIAQSTTTPISPRWRTESSRLE